MKTHVFNMIGITIAVMTILHSCQNEPIFEELNIDNTGPTDTTGTIGGVPDDPCDPDTVYFTNDILPILQSNCAFSGCHGDGSREDDVDLSNYSTIMSTAGIRPFNPRNSKLYRAITETDPDDVMPPPPANKLSADQIAKIEKWISQGALNNGCEGCDTSNVTFSLSIAPLIQNNCQGCHSGGDPGGNIKLTNFLEIQTQALSGNLYGAVNHESGFTAMPYNQPKLSQCKVDQIRIWINTGAPNN